MARFKTLAFLAAFSVLLACGEGGKKPDPGGGGGTDQPAKPAKILSFKATPAHLPVQGGTVTLTWETEEAISGKLFANDEVIVDSVWPLSQGELEVTDVEEPTTFALVIVGDESEDRSEAEVTLAEDIPVIVSFGAIPAEISRGQSTLLRWKVENVDAIEIRDENGQSIDLRGAGRNEGALGIRPLTSTSYTLVATRGEVEVEETAEVNVLPVELTIVSFAQTTSGAHLPGDEIEVNWVIEGGDAATLSNLEGQEISIDEDKVSKGSAKLILGEGRKFRLVATQDDKSVEEEIEIPLLLPATIGDFWALPKAATAPEGKAHLHWRDVKHAATLTLERDTGDPVVLDASQESGNVEVLMDADTRYTLVAWNRAGEDRKEAEVHLVPAPEILLFEAIPARVGLGESISLTWATANAIQVEVEGPLGPVPSVSDWMLNDTITDGPITADSTYTLRAYNEAGDFAEASVTVTVGAPVIVSATLSPLYVAPEQPVTVEWEALGGNSLRLLDPDDNVVFSTSDYEKISQGAEQFLAPLTEGNYSYTLVVDNSDGETTEDFTLLVGIGPNIVSFEADPLVVAEGDPVEFSWVVMDDPLGAPITLGLSDGTTDYDLTGSDPNAGSKSFPMPAEGTYDFTFTASTANGSKQDSVQVRVVGAPTVTLASSATEIDGLEPLILSWTSTNAEEALTVYEVGPGNTLVPVYEVPEGDRASGSTEVNPLDDTTYRIVADNGFGATAFAEVSVTIGPPVIVSFDANPIEVLRGEEVTLSWVTRLAHSVELDLPERRVLTRQELMTDPYVDISTTGTKLNLTDACAWQFDEIGQVILYDADDEGCVDLIFPAGFEFPFGTPQNKARVFANGILSFDFDYEMFTWFNVEFPTWFWPAFIAGLPEIPVHIAPFWDDMVNVEVWWALESHARGDRLIVQWSGEVFSLPTTALEFQAVLWETGEFGFRYGLMSGGGDAIGNLIAAGASATVGVQSLDLNSWNMLHSGEMGANIGATFPGGFGARTWAYLLPDPLDPNGTYEFEPTESLTVTLTAVGAKGQATETVDVIVHEPPSLVVVMPPEEPQADWAFELGWETENVSKVEVLDENESVICTVTTEPEVEAGTCAITEATPGTYDYTVVAHGALGSTVVEDVSIQVFPTFVLESFVANVDVVEPNDPVTLSWIAHGAILVELTANGVDILPPGASPTGDSAVHSPAVRTTYLLRVHAADGRTRMEEVVVNVKTFDFSLGASPDSVLLGEPITLSWNLTPLAGGTPSLYLPMQEVFTAYADISTHPDAVQLIGAEEDDLGVLHSFAQGFSFPFGGEDHADVKVFTDGFVSFDLAATGEGSNEAFPTSGKAQVHIAPFWDDLTSRTNGRVWALNEPGQVTIQWSKFSRWTGSTLANEYNLNFQLVLFDDGAFEFRYGTMAPPPAPSTLCTMENCALDANGASATFGFQNPTSTYGHTLHFGGTGHASSNAPFPGGLANRAFRKDGGTVGSQIHYPDGTGTYEVCAELGDYYVCEEAEVEVN